MGKQCSLESDCVNPEARSLISMEIFPQEKGRMVILHRLNAEFITDA